MRIYKPIGKRILAVFLATVMCFSFLTVLGSCKKDGGGESAKTTLMLATTEQYRTVMEEMVRRFNEQSETAEIELRIYRSEQEKNYFLSHGAGEADIYTFEYALDANRNREYLYELSRNSVSNRYLVGVINNLRAQNGELYVLPADGGYYTMCYNTEMLAARGYEIPATLNDLLTLADRLGVQVQSNFSTAASVGGESSVLIALMSLAYPLYLNTVYGTDFLENFLLGKLSICEGRNKTAWTEIFEDLKILYNRKFYTLADMDQSSSFGVNRFRNKEVLVIQNSPEVIVDRDFAGMPVKCTPFVGKEKRDACFGSMPTMYVSVARKTAENAAKLDAAREFLDYFATPAGQSVIHSLFEGGGEYISYLKTAENTLPEAYAEVQQKANEGRLFLADMFKYAFSICVVDIADYLRGNMSTEELLSVIDARIREGQNSETAPIAEIDRNYEFDSEKVCTGETELGRYFVSALSGTAYLDGVMIPSSYLRGTLLKGTLTERELDFVFPEQSMIFAELTAADFLKIYRHIADTDSYPLTSGLFVRDGQLTRSGGKAVGESERLFVLIPAALKSLLGEDAEVGRETTTKTELLDYFARSSTGVDDSTGVTR